jgi:HK97 family phage major capsid protein
MFVEKSLEEISKMSIEDQTVYMAEKKENDTKVRKEEIESQIKDSQKDNVSKEEVSKLEDRLSEIKEVLISQSLELKGLREAEPLKNKNKGLREFIEENSTVLAEIKANKSRKHDGFSFTVKATEVATDIGSRDYLGTIDTRIGEKPVRSTAIMDLFPRRKVSGEYFHYWEEDVITRDAKFVVACATSVHTTKKTWVKRTVELAKIRDIIDICIDMLSDYSFVESSMRKLIDESIKLKADYELLLGTGVASTDMLSLETVSSEFNASNVLAPFTTAFQNANLEQLADAMSAQITVFGEENAWMADTLVMNYRDFVLYRNLKDANNNKLIHTLSDTVATIAGMRVITSPIVATNTCYVFDSSKGEILDRQAITMATSYENKDNIEHELVTLVGVERLQFNVRLIDRDAFMKCSDVATAITAITKV